VLGVDDDDDDEGADNAEDDIDSLTLHSRSIRFSIGSALLSIRPSKPFFDSLLSDSFDTTQPTQNEEEPRRKRWLVGMVQVPCSKKLVG